MKTKILKDFEEEWAKYIVTMPEMDCPREKEKALQNTLEEMVSDGTLTEEEAKELSTNTEIHKMEKHNGTYILVCEDVYCGISREAKTDEYHCICPQCGGDCERVTAMQYDTMLLGG